MASERGEPQEKWELLNAQREKGGVDGGGNRN